MTIDEASERYNIPIEILQQYERWGLCGSVKTVMGAWQYDDCDLQRLSMVMTLHDVGFASDEIETYMRLMIAGASTQAERLQMLNAKRRKALDDIHLKEKQLERLDYLRHKINQSPQ